MIHPAFATLHDDTKLREMVAADNTLFFTSTYVLRATTSGVVATLLATEDLKVPIENPGV